MIAVCDALYRLATQTDGQRCIPEYWADQQLLGLAAVNDDMRYLASKNGATLKTGLGFVEGHWKWHRLLDEFLLAFHSNYCAILYRLGDIASYWSKIAKFLYPTCI